MLHDTNDQVVNIALSLGETDTKSISRRFKQIYGCSPVEWREKFQKNQ
jgi:transcriptional regulator GlxA family with amidase domain